MWKGLVIAGNVAWSMDEIWEFQTIVVSCMINFYKLKTEESMTISFNYSFKLVASVTL